MADKDYSQLSSLAGDPADADLVAVYPLPSGPLKKVTWLTLITAVGDRLAGIYLSIANNLSDLASASSARANLGLGSAAQLASSALFQVANNLSEVANATTARSNIGAAASDAPSITSGISVSGTSKQSVLAMGALDIDWSAQDIQTKSISANSTFTFSNFTASKGQAIILGLTITSAAVPTWPASVKNANSIVPTLGNGKHLLGLVTLDGGTSVVLVVLSKNYG